MTNTKESESWTTTEKLFVLGFTLILIGVALFTMASILSNGFANSGGIILIGPIPIIFGMGANILPFVFVAAILAIVWILFLIVTRRSSETHA